MNGTQQPATQPVTTPPPAEAQPTDKGPVPYDRFAEVNKELTDLRKWRKEQEQAATERAKQDAAQETARLAEQGQYKQLAEQAQAQVAGLEPYKAQAERYAAALDAQLVQERKGVPDYVLPLLDALDPAAQLEYIAANREKFAPAAQGNGRIPPTPQSGTRAASQQERDVERDARLASIRRLF